MRFLRESSNFYLDCVKKELWSLRRGKNPQRGVGAYKCLTATTPRRVQRFELRLPLLQFISIGILADPHSFLKPFAGIGNGIFRAFFQLLDSLAGIRQPSFHLHLQVVDHIGSVGHPILGPVDDDLSRLFAGLRCKQQAQSYADSHA